MRRATTAEMRLGGVAVDGGDAGQHGTAPEKRRRSRGRTSLNGGAVRDEGETPSAQSSGSHLGGAAKPDLDECDGVGGERRSVGTKRPKEV